jgi:hypothetical protein
MLTSTFLDTNVFIYAVGADHPLRASCRAILDAARGSALTLATNTEVFQELLHVGTRRGRQSAMITLVRRLAPSLDVLSVDFETIALAMEALEGYPTLSARDAVHVGAMRQHQITRIVTADRHFDGVDRIERVAPDRFARENGLEPE